MSVYGVHPTRYGNLNNEQLYSMFRESSYSKLDESEKLDLLQETVNRDSLERGEIGAPEVRFADLPANESGNASNGVINVNRNMSVNGVQSIEYDGQTIQHPVRAYNIETLNTVLHENIHCFQEQVIDGTINIEDIQKSAEYQSNGFTTSAVLQNGKYQLGSQYLTGETANGYYCYYFQSTERDAFLGAEEKTDTILNNIIEKCGTEPSFEAYKKSVEITGYHATERAAIERFQNLNFERGLNQTLMNQYFGMNVPVAPNIENAVKAEMIATYQGLHQQIAQTNNLTMKEDTKMTFDPNKPVSLEEYNATLSHGYIMTYEHMKTDPTLSQEEFVQQASAMSEKYHEAIQEFQEAQDIQNGVNMNEGIQSDSENLGAETVPNVGAETTDIEVSDGSISTSGVDNTDGIDNEGIDDSMDI
ncbi:hypothetical protein [Blautia luti]|uniref:hypothetical protein n=1 Tax=Blautia luti TaxID=89014 RepID=UPI0018ABC287|nr:hypothetical protein [Blautia luti]